MIDRELLKHHDYIGYKSGIHKWIPGDSERVFDHNFEKATALGWTKESITYKIDSLGHRNDFEIDKNKTYNVYLGCSFTYGIAVPNENIWVHVLNRHLNSPAFNLGVPGCSIDTCYRLLKYYIDEIKIDNIFLLVPPLNRREIFRKGAFTVCSIWTPDDFRPLANENDLEINCEKTIDAIGFLCSSKNIKLTFMYSDKPPLAGWIGQDLKGRDLQHPGIEIHEKIAMEFLKNLNTK